MSRSLSSKGERRYSAKLLFQFRVVINGRAGKRRLCEERIVTFTARSARDALRHAKQSGRKGEHAYTNAEGHPVRFEFIGVADLLGIGVECDTQEVWYEISERVQPKERRDAFIPGASKLRAIVVESPRCGINPVPRRQGHTHAHVAG